jgi:hypothetical protein
MRPCLETVARLTMAVLVATVILVLPGGGPGAAVARSSDCVTTIHQLIEGTSTCPDGHVMIFRAYVQRPCYECGGVTAYLLKPRWLDGLDGTYVLLGTGRLSANIPAFVPPSHGRCSPIANLRTCPFHPYQGRWAIVRARYNDPIAQTCRYSEHPPGAGFSKKDAVAECQADLVVLSVGPAAPETDVVATAIVGPGGQPAMPIWVAIFVGTMLLTALTFPVHRRRSRIEGPRPTA